MRHLLPLLGGLLGLLVLAGLALAAIRAGHGDRAPVYPVATVRAGLARSPGSWVGRPLRVRGVAVPCEGTPAGPNAPCMYGLPALRAEAGAGGAMLLGRGQPDRVYAPLRAIPLLRGLVPAPAAFHWGVPATYTVEIVALPDAIAGTVQGYLALLDAAP